MLGASSFGMFHRGTLGVPKRMSTFNCFQTKKKKCTRVTPKSHESWIQILPYDASHWLTLLLNGKTPDENGVTVLQWNYNIRPLREA